MRQNTLRSVISSGGVQVESTPVLIGGGRCVVPPKISVVRDNNERNITSIKVQCGCGEITVIDCVYDSPRENM